MDLGNRVLRPPLRTEPCSAGRAVAVANAPVLVDALETQRGVARFAFGVAEEEGRIQSSVGEAAARSHKAPTRSAVAAIESRADLGTAVARLGDQSVARGLATIAAVDPRPARKSWSWS